MATRQAGGGRGRAALFLVISTIAALIAVLVIYRVIQSYQAELDEAMKPEPTADVIVAAHTLFQGETLTDKDAVVKQIPLDFVPQESVFHKMDEVVGRVPLERILEGEYIRRERLADPEAGVGLNAVIPKGMRAVSINVTDGSAVSGFLNPGNYVDIIVTITPTTGKDAGKKQTLTMLQARKVLAVDNRLGDTAHQLDGNYRPSVTLAVTPEEAERLAHAKIQGDVTLTLRNDVDVTEVTSNPKGTAELIGRKEAPAVPVAPLQNFKPPKVKVISDEQALQITRGGSTTTVKVKSNQ